MEHMPDSYTESVDRVNMNDVDTMCVLSCMSSMHDRLRDARKNAGYSSAAKAAAALGVKTSTYAAHENGQNEFDAETAKHYGRRFKVAAAWLLTGEDDDLQRVPVGSEFTPESDADEHATIGSETGRQGIPTHGIAEVDVTAGLGAGGVTLVSEATSPRGARFSAEVVRDYWVLPSWMLSRLGVRPEHTAAFPMQGDSMEPVLFAGEVGFVDLRHRVPSPPGIYAISDQFGGVMFKRLEVVSRPSDDDTMVSVSSDNPKHATRTVSLAEIYIVGRYIGKFSPE
jgi:phage repressor protein C with HTH and peptisase S24 domain